MQQAKGKSIAGMTKSSSKTPQQAESVSDENAGVKMVIESDNVNKKFAKAYPGRKHNSKTTKSTAKKSDAPSGSQTDICSTQVASLRTESPSGTAVPNGENISSSKIFSDEKIEKDQVKPVDSGIGAEKKTTKATEPDKNETLSSGGVIPNEDNGVETAESVTQPSKGDPGGSHGEPRKTTKSTQWKPDGRKIPVKENKKRTTVKKNEKQSAAVAQNETSGGNSETKSTEMQKSAAKAESTNCNAQTSGSRPSDRNRNQSIGTPSVSRVDPEKKDEESVCPMEPTETSPESITAGESSAGHVADDTTKQIITTDVSDKVVSEASSRKTPSSRKNTKKEKASLKKLEEVCEHNEKEISIRKNNETSKTAVGQNGIDSAQRDGTEIEVESTASAAKTVGSKIRVPKSPFDPKPKSKAQLQKSSSMVAVSVSKSKTSVAVDRAKISLLGDTGLTEGKTVCLKKSESYTATTSDDSAKRQSAQGKGAASHRRQKICSLNKQRKNTKGNDSELTLQHPNSKTISSFTKEGKTESNVPVEISAPESALKNVRKREESKQLTTVNSEELDGDQSPRKTKADQKSKAEESVQNTGTGDVDRAAKIQSKTLQEKGVESAETARLPKTSPRTRRPKLTGTPEEMKATADIKAPDTKTAKEVTEEKSHTPRKGENAPETALPKHGNSPRKRTDEDEGTEAKQRPICVQQETRTNDKLNNVDSAQKKGQAKHEPVPSTVTVTLKAGDRKRTSNKSADDTVRTGETVECTISANIKSETGEANRNSGMDTATNVTKKKEQRSSKPREQPGQKMAASGPSTVTGDGVKVGSPRKQTADQKDANAKAKNIDEICVVIEEIPQEQKSKTLAKTEADPHKKQRIDTNQEQSAKDSGLPQSSPRKSPRTVSKTAPASSPRSEVSPKINSLDTEETKGAARIAIVEIEEINEVPVSVREKQKSSPSSDVTTSGNTKYKRNQDSTKTGSAREPDASPRSKQTATKKGMVPSGRAFEHSEDNTAAAVTQCTSKTDALNAQHNGINGPETARSTSPQRLIAQLRTFMTQASLLHKLDLKTKILECMGVNEIKDGYKIPGNRKKLKTSTTDLQKVAAALKVGRKRLEDQTGSKVLEKGKMVSIRIEDSSAALKKSLHGVMSTRTDVGSKSSIGRAEEARNKLIGLPRGLLVGKHWDGKSATGSSGLSSSSDTPKPILVKDRARKRKARTERKGVPRVRFSDTTSGLTTASSRPSYSHGSKRQRWASATPEISARVKKVSPRRHGGSAGPKFPVGIVSSTMLALKRMRPSSVEKCRSVSPPASRKTSKPLSTAAVAMMAVTMKAREIAKVPQYGTKAATEHRSRSPRAASVKKQATKREANKKRNWKTEQRTGEIVIRGLTAVADNFPVEDRMEEGMSDFVPLQQPRKQRERPPDEYDRTPVISQTYSEADKPVSPRTGMGYQADKVMPTWHSASYAPSPRKPSKSPTSEKSPTLRVLHDNKRQLRSKTTVINSSPTEVPCSVAITKKTSVPAPSGKRSHQSSRTTRKAAGAARASIEHVVNIDIRMGSLAKDSTAPEDGRARPETPSAKNSIVTKDSSVGTEEMQVLDVCIRALPAAGDDAESDETSVHTLMRAKDKSETGGGDVDDAACDSSESMLALTDVQAGGAGDRIPSYGVDADADAEADEDSGAESDASSKTWPRATLVTPTTKTLAASFPRFSTSSVPEEAARATAALERSLRLVARACQSRPLECDLRWSAWLSALHAGDPDAAATPFPASLSRSGRRDVDMALAASVRVPALWLLAGLRAAELGARTVKLLHWLLVRLPAEGPALTALHPKELTCPCKPSAAFKVRVCAGSSLDARLRWRARGLPAFEAWASPAPCQLHGLVCGGATTPVGVLSLTLAGALRRAQPGYGCGASRLGSRLRCVLKCQVAHHPELVERIGADAVVVRGLDLVRVRQLLVFNEPLPEGALAVWAARALKRRRLVVAVASIVLTYLLVAIIAWVADPAIVGLGDGADLLLRRILPWPDEPEPPAATHRFSFWA
ncbi:uncharacterized protein LOC126346969 [Schistocerca gregaria]|uniref:uncharacterized protein LOC126346969 n=1 Tax=Schistocerca gregaria TaxID=7010 RepID=UPI00211EA86A|nr:uncharacterized protein LOC126346969 [Schistocerca gregaria]